MIFKPKQNNNDESLNHRRMGGAFDVMARIFRNINKMVFGTGTTINDRPGVKEAGGNISGFVNSKSVFEIFQEKEPISGYYNFIVFGKKATTEKTNTNYIDLSVNSKSQERSVANGSIAFRLTRDGNKETYRYSKIALYEADNYPDNFAGNGARAEITGEGIGGGVQLTYIENDAIKYAFVLDNDGIQLYGLPTSAPSGSNKLWNSGGFIKIT